MSETKRFHWKLGSMKGEICRMGGYVVNAARVASASNLIDLISVCGMC